MELGFANVRMYETLYELRGRQVLNSWLVVHPVNVRRGIEPGRYDWWRILRLSRFPGSASRKILLHQIHGFGKSPHRPTMSRWLTSLSGMG